MLEAEPFGIKVRQLEPGFFATKIFANREIIEKSTMKNSSNTGASPYQTFEEAVRALTTANVAEAADPQIVADAIVKAAEAKKTFPVHRPVGEDAELVIKEAEVMNEEEQAASWKRMVGI
ncbi:hypothetical protein [Alteribacillus bidgolensis]|uniref:hypothetical protein n=1 Tax=Alteribacillus bidgolensis TaxID=930129 RepID=UPI000B8510D6|nr:hypothetical protein [Alteribacillus bidgolensis]